ncbi:hypothetical protein CLU79DRAFT_689887, partial [Phycomyces nitens]
LCEDVFVSYNTFASNIIAERDTTSQQYTFEYCSGTTQDLIKMITKSARSIRLVVIDYAGLSTNPDDIRLFLSLNKSVREIVVEVGNKAKVFSRFDLLKKDTIIKRFQCRKQ